MNARRRPQQAAVAHRTDMQIRLTGLKVGEKIDIVMKACGKLDRRVKERTVALIRQLIATRHLFPADVPGSEQLPRVFDLHAPVQNLWIGRAGVRALLHEVSPALAEQENVVEGICHIANYSVPKNCKEKHLRDSPLTRQDAIKAPEEWPAATQLFVLKLGNWDEIHASDIQLPNADLRGIRCKHAVLSEANLEGADASDSVLPGADFRGSRLAGCRFINADLRSADFGPMHDDGTGFCNADNAIFNNANLTHLKASGAHFIKAHFEGARVDSADFTGTHLSYSTGLVIKPGLLLTDAELLHAKISSDMNVPKLFDRLDNVVRWHLRTLSTITRQRDDLHNDGLLGLIKITGAEFGRLKNIGPLAKTLLTQERCWPDEALRKFTDTHILPKLLSHWNSDGGDIHKISPRQAMSYIIANKSILDWPKYGGAISQMLIDAEVTQRIDARNALCTILKKNPTILSVAQAISKQDVGPFEDCSTFIAPDFKSAMVYTNSQILKMLDRTGSPCGGHYFVRGDDGSFTRNKSYGLDALKACVPVDMFNIYSPPAGAVALIEYIFRDKAFSDPLVSALSFTSLSSDEHVTVAQDLPQGDIYLWGSSREKLSGLRPNDAFSVPQCRIFWHKMVSVGLTLEENDENTGRLLYSMAALFVRCASPEMFGAKENQADMFVNLALNFLNAAHMFNPDHVSVYASALLTLSQIHSEGRRNFFMEDIKNDPALATCFNAVYPQAWLPTPR
jgi:uncharacterized protein YjbI with pentapeptide repeats